MHEYVYSVNMDTQLGQRPGIIRLHTNGIKIEGLFIILENEELIHGELIGNGKCKLHGQIVTRMRTVEYTAEGSFDDEKIDLILHCERNEFHVSGIATSLRERGDINEKIL